MITIGVKWINKEDAVNIYCGRGSRLGNPYVMSNESERDFVCDSYEKFLFEQLENPDSNQSKAIIEICQLVNNGEDVNLQCYCKDKRCHCESIKRAVEMLVGYQK